MNSRAICQMVSFPMTLNDPNLDFKVTIWFNVKCIVRVKHILKRFRRTLLRYVRRMA